MNLEQKRVAALEAAQSIIDAAKSDGRSLTEDERADVRAKMSESETLRAQMKQADEDDKLRKSLSEALVPDAKSEQKGEKRQHKSLGAAFVDSDAYLNAVTAVKSGSRFTTAAVDTGLDLKALTTTGARIGDVQEGSLLAIPQQQLTVAQLFAQGQMSGSVLSYLRETAATNAAAAVAESGLKPASELTLDRVEHSISKIATTLDVPDEFLEDMDAARSYIDGRLTLFIQQEEERQLLDGSGTAPNLRGLLNTAGVQTETAVGVDDNIEALYRAITKVRTVALFEPDAVVINPLDYQRERLARDNNGQFYAGGPFIGTYGQGGVVNDAPLWGLRTVVSSAVAAGTALVGAFNAGGQVFRKGGISVDATNSDGEKFRSNITTIRAEERVGLAIYRPSAFVRVTLDDGVV